MLIANKSNISPLRLSTMNTEGRCRQLSKQEPGLYRTKHDEETRPTAEKTKRLLRLSNMNTEGRCRQLSKQENGLYHTKHDEETRPTAEKTKRLLRRAIRKETDIRYSAMRSKQLRERARLQNSSRCLTRAM